MSGNLGGHVGVYGSLGIVRRHTSWHWSSFFCSIDVVHTVQLILVNTAASWFVLVQPTAFRRVLRLAKTQEEEEWQAEAPSVDGRQ
jgi:hypothetical protein